MAADRSHRIALIPGDGIGTEVSASASAIIDALAELHGFRPDVRTFDWSCERHLAEGAMMPADGLEVLRGFDAILLGAVGRPDVPDHVSLWGLLIPIRRTFGQYVNLRPVRTFAGVPAPLSDVGGGIDLVIVRENTEGEYSDIGGRVHRGRPEEAALQQAVFTRAGITRISEFAFALAETRRGHVTSATKSNGLIHSMPFWDEVVREQAANHPQVQLREEHIDALAAKLVLAPLTFDVILASNLFGDILSDLAAAITGSIGIAPSANLDPSGQNPPMFEPVHGSAPDIAGKGIANPVGMLWSTVLLLEHMNEHAAASQLFAAVERSLADPQSRTADIGGTATTAEATDAVLGHLADLA